MPLLLFRILISCACDYAQISCRLISAAVCFAVEETVASCDRWRFRNDSALRRFSWSKLGTARDVLALLPLSHLYGSGRGSTNIRVGGRLRLSSGRSQKVYVLIAVNTFPSRSSRYICRF